MTLHWWMHWFWVTALLTIHASSGPSSAAPQSEELQHVRTDFDQDRKLTARQNRALYIPKIAQVSNLTVEEESVRTERQYTKAPQPAIQVSNTSEEITEKTLQITNETIINPSNATIEIVHPSIQWTAVNVTDINGTTTQNSSVANTTVTPYTNLTDTQNSTYASKKRNLTRPDFVKDGAASAAESRIVTEKPLSLETMYSLQTRIPPNIESSRRVIDQGDGGMDTGAIAGISFAALVLAALAGSTAFVLYRRRYLNKPQTLNDKCSNPDSSGYLDDSTIRDNSEEMYSLDNDSFLNSLEAMTIQNYWTDTVKHTKL